MRTARTALAAAVLAGVVGMQAAASLETEAMYARTAPALPAARLDLADLARIVPPHASVLMLDPLTPLPIDGITLTQNTALFSDAAYFLVDRNAITTTDPYFVLRVQYLGVDPALPARPTPEQEAGFDFILTITGSPDPPPDPAAFPLRWISREAGLALYQRRP